MGIGNPSRRDDGVGLRVVELLKERRLGGVLLLETETVPESYTGSIRDYSPTHVLLIDAAQFRGEPGEGRMIPQQLIGNVTASTHSIPLDVLMGYIRKSICDKVALLGIQVAETKMGVGFTHCVEEGAKEIAATIYDVLKNEAV